MDYKDIEARTHSPKGEYAATDENYERLLSRLKTERPVSSQAVLYPNAHSWMRKWSVAASIAVLCVLAWAVAWQNGWTDVLRLWPASTELAPAPQALSFTDTPLSNVLMSISAKYGVEVDMTNLHDDMNITAEFAADEPLNEVLEALSMVSGFDITMEGTQIVVR